MIEIITNIASPRIKWNQFFQSMQVAKIEDVHRLMSIQL